MLATYLTQSKDNAPNPEDMTEKSREYITMQTKKYSFSDNQNLQGVSQQQQMSTWYKTRDDMDNRRSWEKGGSADHYKADCTSYKQGMKSKGYDIHQMRTT